MGRYMCTAGNKLLPVIVEREMALQLAYARCFQTG